ncbi:hypothetical protein A3I18_00160 [Candidatus Campbellbacteria bacterium RIFCSPLOWO2_02_FULL_35_11]|uniref:Uncharacterized protein n=2 Tax=Candidatus Campbelliibacteriota TaxID=1752727 RepID=A0A1F5ENC2_9BACT|nr:MAG: hypothetical protein A3E89_02945 [Candidatus Campbellbacteria bacterium RIFCSPHIGHO2_12_FULL_35_10]OGD70052.1 MAG: hypothetical protein A3I18_00160 [Candidatus Campbellbacteria bacterium RIFCSPLOWO2_02_FULL_35_11]OGH65414.1 MAG: hypothetical protein A3B83_01035 [Candidatus Magasanikbacteria bacterium RIFCSPHIGHO2_02_FULL_33_17]
MLAVIIFGYFLIVLFINHNLNVEIVAEIVTSITLVLALATYFYQKNKDKNLMATEVISFFRKEIIPQCDSFIFFVRQKKGESYYFQKVRLDNPNFEYINKNYATAVVEQNNIYRELKTWPMQTTLLNMLTELALKIKYFKIVDHDALNTIKAPFVEMVEINAVVLLMHRDIVSGNSTYLEVINLYLHWKDSVDRRLPDERSNELMMKIADNVLAVEKVIAVKKK